MMVTEMDLKKYTIQGTQIFIICLCTALFIEHIFEVATMLHSILFGFFGGIAILMLNKTIMKIKQSPDKPIPGGLPMIVSMGLYVITITYIILLVAISLITGWLSSIFYVMTQGTSPEGYLLYASAMFFLLLSGIDGLSAQYRNKLPSLKSRFMLSSIFIFFITFTS
jgi:hypothetical protein